MKWPPPFRKRGGGRPKNKARDAPDVVPLVDGNG